MTEPKLAEEGLNVVIGLGDGGIAKLTAVQALARREGIEEQVLPIGINSRSTSALDGAIKTIELRKPEQQHLRDDKRSRPYLTDGHEIAQQLAARREPRIGRYYVDTPENLGKIEDSLWESIHAFISEFRARPGSNSQSVNIFLMSAAGGGTGNGTTPIVTGMLDAITEGLNQEFGVNFQLFGLVTVSNLQSFNRGGTVPDVDLDYLVNTWALLEQLRAITGEGDAEYPLRIPLTATEEGADIRREAYEFTANPFDAVYLLPFAEDNDERGDRYERGINETAAALVHYWMRQDAGQQDIENEISDLDHTFYEVQAATLETPTDAIEGLSAVEAEIDDLEATVESHESRRADIETALTQVEQATAIHGSLDAAVEGEDDGPGDDADEAPAGVGGDDAADGSQTTAAEADSGLQSPVQTVRDRCRETVENLRIDRLNEEVLDERVASLQSQLQDDLHDRVESDPVVAVVTHTALLNRLARERAGHGFPDRVEELADENTAALREFDPTFDGSAPPLVRWREYVRPFLVDRKDRIESEVDTKSRLFDRSERARLTEKRAEIEIRIDHLDGLATEYERITDCIETVRDRLDEAHERLADHRSTLRTTWENLHETIESVRVELEAARERRQGLYEELAHEQLGRYVTLPVVDPERLDPERLGENPSISTLVETGIVDEERVANLVTSLLDSDHSQPLDDQLMTRTVSREPATATPTMLVSEENTPYLWEGAAGDDDVQQVAQALMGDSKTVYQRDGSRATLLALYGGLTFENFEHARLRDTAERGDARLLDQSVDLRNAIAYRELLPDDHYALRE